MITGKIISTEEDERKNIVIWICFTQDGKEIPFYRGAELLERDGHKVWPLYSRFENFLGKTPAQISEWIRINVEAQAGNIIKEQSKAGLNADIMTEIGKLAGTEYSADKVGIPIDPGCTGTDTATAELKSDGTYTVK